MSAQTPARSRHFLEVNHLTVSFPARKEGANLAVDDVCFHIDQGECLGLVGESGSGKTTIGRVIVGLTTATSGSVAFDGNEIVPARRPLDRFKRRGMQIVFQDAAGSLNPRLTIGTSVGEPLALRGVGTRQERSRKVGELLEHVGLPAGSAQRFPHEFSGGQRQRIAVARALAARPTFIVFDEPVSALDVSVQAQILNLLSDLRREFSLTYLLISHNLAVVAGFCERVAVMQRGRIVEAGPSGSVFGSPHEAYTQGLLAAAPVLFPRKDLPLASHRATAET